MAKKLISIKVTELPSCDYVGAIVVLSKCHFCQRGQQQHLWYLQTIQYKHDAHNQIVHLEISQILQNTTGQSL